MNDLDKAAQHCHDMLGILQEQYRKAAQPFIDRLIAIENIRPRSYMVDGRTYVPIDAGAAVASSPDGEKGR